MNLRNVDSVNCAEEDNFNFSNIMSGREMLSRLKGRKLLMHVDILWWNDYLSKNLFILENWSLNVFFSLSHGAKIGQN